VPYHNTNLCGGDFSVAFVLFLAHRRPPVAINAATHDLDRLKVAAIDLWLTHSLCRARILAFSKSVREVLRGIVTCSWNRDGGSSSYLLA